MLPLNVDPGWYRRYWYGEPAAPSRNQSAPSDSRVMRVGDAVRRVTAALGTALRALLGSEADKFIGERTCLQRE